MDALQDAECEIAGGKNKTIFRIDTSSNVEKYMHLTTMYANEPIAPVKSHARTKKLKGSSKEGSGSGNTLNELGIQVPKYVNHASLMLRKIDS